MLQNSSYSLRHLILFGRVFFLFFHSISFIVDLKKGYPLTKCKRELAEITDSKVGRIRVKVSLDKI